MECQPNYLQKAFINKLKECKSNKTLRVYQNKFKKYDFVILEEFGYISSDKEGA